MDFELEKNVLHLRKLALERIIDIKNETNNDERSEIVVIDEIISTLTYFDELFTKAEEEIQGINEMAYYDFLEAINKKDEMLRLALNLKSEIIKERFDNDSRFANSHEQIIKELEGIDEKEEEYALKLKQKIACLLSNIHLLKDRFNEDEKNKLSSLNPLIVLIQKLNLNYSEIYDDIYETEDCNYDYYDDENNDNNTYGTTEYDPESYNLDDDEIEDDIFEINSAFNYDEISIEDIYDNLFGEIFDEQRVLIGIMISDFYEYHKCNEEMYSKDYNEDILLILDIIEQESYDDIINFFLQQYEFALFIIDSYVYYNLNFKREEKLINRQKIKEIGKLDILKKHNKFINDTLTDTTLDNIFITPIGDLIRRFTSSLYINLLINSNSEKSCVELLYEYFTTDYVPNDISILIPQGLKDDDNNTAIDIKLLKKLQLDFMLSDFLIRGINQNDNNVISLLSYSAKHLHDMFISNRNMLKFLINDYIEISDNEDEIKEEENLSDNDKQKIYKINKLTILDI